MIGQLADLPLGASYIVLGYLSVRTLVPVLLIAVATRHATPAQRISLVRDYLTGQASPKRHRKPDKSRADELVTPPPRS